MDSFPSELPSKTREWVRILKVNLILSILKDEPLNRYVTLCSSWSNALHYKMLDGGAKCRNGCWIILLCILSIKCVFLNIGKAC